MDDPFQGKLRREIFQRWVPTLGMLGAGVAAVGTFWSVNWLTLVGALMAVLATMVSTVKQAEFEEKLTFANEKLLNQAEEIARLVTGGDSFAYLLFQSGTTFLIAVHQGRYALSDVDVRVSDLDAPLPHGVGYNSVLFKVGRMTPGLAVELGQFPIDPSRPVRNLNIFFVAKNGHWHQELRQRLVGDQWLSAWRVKVQRNVNVGNHDWEILGETVQTGYPINAQGNVDWDSHS